MLYDSYEKRIRITYTILKQIHKFRYILIAIAAVVSLTLTGYSLVKGMHYNVSVVPNVTYGESLGIETKTLFSSVEYTYRRQGEEQWSQEAPLTTGDYEVRISTQRVFGRGNHRVMDFSITPKAVSLTMESDSVAFGDDPLLKGDLSQGDYIDHVSFIFHDLSSDETTFDIESYVIKNADGFDVTDSYNIDLAQNKVAFVPREIVIKPAAEPHIYDGETFTSNEGHVLEGSLVEGHEIFISTTGSQKDVGFSDNEITDARIMDGDVDVTENYNITFKKGILEVVPHPLTVETGNKSKIYDEKTLYSEAFDLVQGDLVDGHSLKVVENTQISNAKTVNNALLFKVVDDYGNDVSKNYAITTHEGILEILPKPLTVQSFSDMAVYDGTSLSNDGFDIIEHALLENHAIHVIETTSIRNAEKTDNVLTFEILDADGQDITSNYKITQEYGTLEVTPRPVTIRLTDQEKVYDGEALTSNTVEIIEGTLIDNHHYVIEASGSQTNVGGSENTILSVEIFNGHIDVTSNYVITTEEGTIEVTPRPITIKTSSDDKVYDSSKLSNQAYEIIDGTLVNGDNIYMADYTAITNVGVIDNVLDIEIHDAKSQDQTQNYLITFDKGTLEVTPRPITLRLIDKDKVYDGETLKSNAIEITVGSLVNHHDYVIEASGSKTNVGVSENTILSVGIFDGDEDETSNYSITTEAGTLEVTPRPITIRLTDQEKVYDGEALTSNTVEIIEGTLIDHHDYVIEASGSKTNVGISGNHILEAIIYDGDTDVTLNYDITTEEGTLEVTPRPITIKTSSDEKVYDGSALSNQGYEIIDGTLVNNQFIHVNDNATIINVGVIDNTLDIEIHDAKSQDQTKNYLITFDKGTLEVIPRPITLRLIDKDKVYDGETLRSNAVKIIDGSLVEAHHYVIEASGSQTNVGVSDNQILKVSIFDGDTDVTSNYDIKTEDGTLEVTPRPITVRTSSDEKVYDGSALSNQGFVIIEGNLADGQSIIVVDYATLTNVGLADNTLDIEIHDTISQDQTQNYVITFDKGTLEVTPRPITLRLIDKEKVYDGDALRSNLVEIIEGSIVEGHQHSIAASGSQTNVGISDNHILEAIIFDGDTDVTSNYTITTESGTLEVTPRPITVRLSDMEKIYDGTALTSNIIEVISGSFVEGHVHSLEASGSQTNVGVSDNAILSVGIFDGETNVTSNYDITTEDGTLEVTPRPITVRTASDEKVYDGTNLFNLGFEIIEGSLVLDHMIEALSYSEVTNVEIIDNHLELIIVNQEGEDYTFNYEITLDKGTLEVTPRPITIETGSASKVYDAMPLYDEYFEMTQGSLVLDHEINLVDRKEITNAGITDNALGFIIVDSDDNDVSANYVITLDTGTLEITPLPLTIRTYNASKVYDGLVLYNEEYDVTEGGLLSNHEIYVEERSEIINVKKVENILTFTIVDENENDITGNYDITLDKGKLEVKPIELTIETVSDEKIFSGNPLYNHGFEIIEGEIIAKHVITVDEYTKLTNVGEVGNELTFIIHDASANDVTANYSITLEKGTLEVVPRPITVETSSQSKTYDGTPIYDQGFDIIEGSLVDGHITEVDSHTEFSYIGQEENVLSFTITDGEVEMTQNYVITIEKGILEITPIPIIISSASDSKGYDGTPLENPAWDLSSGSLLDEHTLVVQVTGSITELGKAFNTFDYEILDENSNDASMYYSVSMNKGTLEIEPANILLVIISGSDAKTYDGLPLTNDTWNLAEGDLIDGHELHMDVHGEITEIGSTPNEYTHKILDEHGNDVTDIHYDIVASFGELTVFGEDGSADNNKSSAPISDGGDLQSPMNIGPPLFRVRTGLDDLLYLRGRSYGDYNKQGFNSPTLYENPSDINPLMFPSLAMGGTLDTTLLEFEALTTGLSYYLPYYATDGYYDNLNDVFVTHSFGLGYEVDYVPIGSLDYDAYTLEGTEYEAYELAYRDFVYQNYLDVPKETRAALLEIAERNNLSKNSDTLIEDVQNFILNSAIYNKEYATIPNNVDFAIYFLEHSREGVCQHFAMAATVMYQSLGIPARYTTGFTTPTVADEWVEVGALQKHAWVEIYIDGFGWKTVEVTPGNSSGTGTSTNIPSEGGFAVCEGDLECEEPPLISVTSGNASKIFDGEALYNHDYFTQGNLRDNHTLDIVFDQTITNVGEIRNTFEVVITDEDGTDITEYYNIRKVYGSLVVVPDNGKDIFEIQLYDINQNYNGEIVTHDDNDYWIPSQNLPEGYRVVFDIEGELEEASFIATHIIRSSMRIYDENGMDVTTRYNIVFYDGSIEVLQRSLTLHSYSAEKDYDGEPLERDEFYLSQGSLAEGHEIFVEINGSQTEAESSPNTIDSVTILDSSGNDVTKNYALTVHEGMLVVLE